MEFKTGTLVNYRNRPWIVQQSRDPDLILLKPLGGTDEEITGIYRPLYGDASQLQSYTFKKPSKEDVNNNSYPSAARILYQACRLSFRDIAGPIRCLGRLSFEPRPYQMVPLLLALKQQTVRLLISDDVGIGKTLEALLIAKELLDRGEISHFAVICLPHLCEQWQNEIRDKFGLNAEIIRSSTIGHLERQLRGDQNVFRDIPFQVISIDYIKQPDRVNVFLEHCPEFVIVDEVHTCARPHGASNSQQLRYKLLHNLSLRNKHLVLLTATPHSGHSDEFQSIIGLLKPEFESYELDDEKERQELSRYFVQRRRADINQYLGNECVFPRRIQLEEEKPYEVLPEYLQLLHELIAYIKESVNKVSAMDIRKRRYIYWDLLAMMRGVMSSPDAGISMLQNKIDKTKNDSEENTDDTDPDAFRFNTSLKDLMNSDDVVPDSYETASIADKRKFGEFIRKLQSIRDNGKDAKVRECLNYVQFALDENKNPIVFCQYIQTAEYVGKYLSAKLASQRATRNVQVDIITSRLPDEERKARIDELSRTDRHVLVCTDCLSEGVNLQQGFDAVIHYDLPWNPNRMEQRNGRVDRFGQNSSEVMVSTIHSDSNPVDDFVLNILYKKQNNIRTRLGVYIPIADNDASLMEEIMKRFVTTNISKSGAFIQEELFRNDGGTNTNGELFQNEESGIRRIENIEKKSHTYFAHNTKQMDPSHLVSSLEAAKEVIGGVYDTEEFAIAELKHIGVNVRKEQDAGYSFLKSELTDTLKHYFRASDSKIRISFLSPTPKGFMYIGRNHPLIEDLSRGVINDTINGGNLAACRAMVLETDKVKSTTSVLLMRVRSVIREKKQSSRELVGEEMIFLGFRGNVANGNRLSQDECRNLFFHAAASGDTDIVSQKLLFARNTEWFHNPDTLRRYTDDVAMERANRLVESFTQYRAFQSAPEYCVVEPVLPMDVIAAYLFLPKL